MRKVIVAAFISMDGVMQAPGGPEEDPAGGFRFGGWVWPLGDEAFGEEIDKLFSQSYDLLLGRRTYEIFASYWPYQDEDGPNADITKSFNSITKYVASRKGVDLTWKNSVALRDAAADVARLKKENGPALVTQGSGDLIQTLLANDLVDEIRTFTFPILLGKGKRLFGDRSKPAAFKLTSSKVSPNGIVIASYERAGDVQTGTFETKPPSQAELARREKWKRQS